MTDDQEMEMRAQDIEDARNRARGEYNYKDVFIGYFEAVQEFTERTGKPAPEILFVLNDNTFKVDTDNEFKLELTRIASRSRDRNRLRHER